MHIHAIHAYTDKIRTKIRTIHANTYQIHAHSTRVHAVRIGFIEYELIVFESICMYLTTIFRKYMLIHT